MLMLIKTSLAKNLIFRILFWSFIVIVLLATLTPLDGVEPLSWSFADKIIHLVIFLMLTILMYLAYPKKSSLFIILIMVGFGLLIEVLQHSLPTGRSFDWYDWHFDNLGVLLGFVICVYTPILRITRHFVQKIGY